MIAILLEEPWYPSIPLPPKLKFSSELDTPLKILAISFYLRQDSELLHNSLGVSMSFKVWLKINICVLQ
jgi:hypothetical protein